MSPRLLLLLLCLNPLSLWAAQMPGIRLYEQGEYSKASRSLQAEVNNPRRSEKDRARARVYLAASLLALAKKEEARQQLEALALSYPEQQVDPAVFPPELVDLELQVRSELQAERLREQAERERLAAAEEAERLRREKEAEALHQTSDEEPQGEAPVATASTFRFRPEVTGFIDGTKNQAWGLGAGVTLGQGMFEASLRGLIAPKWGLQLDAGLVFGSGVIQPRLAARVTGAMGLGESKGLGLGGVAGVRLTLSSRLTLLVDTGLERFFFLPPSYKTVVWMTSAGVGFNLF